MLDAFIALYRRLREEKKDFLARLHEDTDPQYTLGHYYTNGLNELKLEEFRGYLKANTDLHLLPPTLT